MSADRLTAQEIRDASWNAVAVASLSYQQALTGLRTIVQTASGHGMSELQIIDASGLPASMVHRLLGEVG